jgi:RNA-binding protein
MDKLKGSQRKDLRSQAHHLRPLVIIGAKGVTDQLIGSVDLALKDHELIKVKFGEFKEDKKEISGQIAQATKSEVVGIIGNMLSFIARTPNRKKEKSKYRKSDNNDLPFIQALSFAAHAQPSRREELRKYYLARYCRGVGIGRRNRHPDRSLCQPLWVFQNRHGLTSATK